MGVNFDITVYPTKWNFLPKSESESFSFKPIFEFIRYLKLHKIIKQEGTVALAVDT